MTAPMTSDEALEALLAFIRPAVRRQQAYYVGAIPNVQVKLNQNESPYDLPEGLKQELVGAFMEIACNRYPTEQPDRLRRKLAERTGHDPDGILIGNGSNELSYTLGLTMIEDAAAVVLPAPMFALYTTMVNLYGGHPVQVPPTPDLRFDTDALCAAIRRTRPVLTVVTTPNNPTGLAMPLDEVERILHVSEGFVVVDEAYLEFNDQPSAQVLMKKHPNLLVMRTLSKAFGLAGLRLGYLMGPPRIIREMLKARLPFMVDRFSEAVALALLERPMLLAERVARLKASIRRLTAELAAVPGVEVVPSQTNFVLFKSRLEPDVMMGRLAEAGILVRNMGGYPELQGYLRVTAGTEWENKAFLAALKEANQK